MSDGLAAGRELDALVAEKVMGWAEVSRRPIANAQGEHVIDEYTGRAPGGPPQGQLVPRYSTRIQDAWPLADRLREEHAFVALISGKGPAGAQPWICKVNKEGVFIEERGETAPLALCRASLRSVGHGA
jgi:hypothetical protein